jgi:hypothetical protein
LEYTPIFLFPFSVVQLPNGVAGGAWTGRDNAWQQEKLEARKSLPQDARALLARTLPGGMIIPVILRDALLGGAFGSRDLSTPIDTNLHFLHRC